MCELTKKCTACGEIKELSNYYTDNSQKDKLFKKCKKCINEKKLDIKDVTSDEKICKKCGIVKKLDEFRFAKKGKLGREAICKICKNNTPKPHKSGSKVCSLCNFTKEFKDFSRDTHSKDGYTSACLICRRLKVRAEKEDVSDGFKTCSTCFIRKSFNEYSKGAGVGGLSPKCKECKHFYYVDNFERFKHSRKEYREKNKDYMKEYLKTYFLQNKERIYVNHKLYNELHKEEIKEYKRAWIYNKKCNNKLFKLETLIRNRIKSSTVFKETCSTSSKILGCTFEEFKQHIESQFESWMSWDNQGNICDELEYNCSWDLDHIIPTSWATTIDELYALNHWSNFQPLCSKVNRNDKRDKILPLCNRNLNMTVY